MTREEAMAELRMLMSAEFAVPPEKLVPEASLRGTLGMHSLQLVSLAVLLEERYPWLGSADEDFELYSSLETLGELADLMVARAGEAG